jgi:hypothetical protein
MSISFCFLDYLQKIRVTNFMCRHDDRLVKDVVCAYKPVRGIFGVFSFAITLVQPVESFWVNLVFSSFQLSIKTSFFSRSRLIHLIRRAQTTIETDWFISKKICATGMAMKIMYYFNCYHFWRHRSNNSSKNVHIR